MHFRLSPASPSQRRSRSQWSLRPPRRGLPVWGGGGTRSGRVYRSLTRFGFPGPIYPVNPRNKTVWDGQTCYPSLCELPEQPDHVVVIVPGAAAIETIVEAGKAKARSATVFSGGFGEGGDPKGRALAVDL